MKVCDLIRVLRALPEEAQEAEVAIMWHGDMETANVVLVFPPCGEDGDTAWEIAIASKLYCAAAVEFPGHWQIGSATLPSPDPKPDHPTT